MDKGAKRTMGGFAALQQRTSTLWRAAIESWTAPDPEVSIRTGFETRGFEARG
jgi:hypothetical protein